MKYWLPLFLGGILLAPLLLYGTVSPCEMLKKEAKAQLLAKSTGVGGVLAFAIGGRVIDDAVDTLSPITCLIRFMQMKYSGGGLFDQSGSTASAVDCTVKGFKWRNSHNGTYMFVEGIVSPQGIRMIHIQAFDAKGNFLGRASAPILPGGAFSTNIDYPNPTAKLNLKYTCE